MQMKPVLPQVMGEMLHLGYQNLSSSYFVCTLALKNVYVNGSNLIIRLSLYSYSRALKKSSNCRSYCNKLIIIVCMGTFLHDRTEMCIRRCWRGVVVVKEGAIDCVAT